MEIAIGVALVLAVIGIRQYPRKHLTPARKRLLTKLYVTTAVLQIASWVVAILAQLRIESQTYGQCPSTFNGYTIATSALAFLSLIPVIVDLSLSVKEKQRFGIIWAGAIFVVLVFVSYWSVIISLFCLTF